MDAAVLRARLGLVGAALAGAHHRLALALHTLLLAELERALDLRHLLLALDVDAPSGELAGQPGVLPLLADGEGELVVGDDDRRGLLLVVDDHLPHAGRRERLGDEACRVVVVRDDVDALAAQLADHHPHTGAAGAHAGADGVDAVGVRHHGDLAASGHGLAVAARVPRLARHLTDLHQAVGDLRDLELEQLAHQLLAPTRELDLGTLGRLLHPDDHGLDALAVFVVLGVDLLAARQLRLHATQLDQRGVPRIALLHDAGDQFADAVDVFLIHEVTLRLADALEDDLLGGHRRDAAEVVGRDLHALDLAHVDAAEVEPDLLPGLLVADLEGLGVHMLREDELVDPHVAGLGVDLDRGVVCRVGGLLVGGEERVLESLDKSLEGDALLALDLAQGLDDLSAHVRLRGGSWV